MWWRVDAGPYWDMPMGERDRLIGAFHRWIAGLQGEAWVHALVVEDTVEWEDLRADYRAPRFYIEASPHDDPAAAGIPAEPSLPPARPRPVRPARGAMVLLEGGQFARAYLVSALPPQLPEAALAIYDIADEIHMKLEPHKDPGSLRKRASRLQQYAVGELAGILGALQLLLQETIAGMRILRLKTIIIIKSDTPSGLKEKSTKLEAELRALGIKYQLTYLPRAQKKLHNLKTNGWKGLLVSSGAAPVLYPFISEELAHPGGVFLGFNLRTGSPIVYNPYRMPNYNFVILGETGSGKSLTGKLYIRRWWRRHQAPVYIIDPSGEYARVADRLVPRLGVHRVLPGEGGLDPVRLWRMGLLGFEVAYEILSDAYGLGREERLRLLEALEGAESMEDLLGVLREARLDMGLYRGSPPMVEESGAVFDLSELQGRRQKVIAGALIAALLRPRLRGKALLVVDEGWMWSSFPGIMAMLAETSRIGRKYGVNFLFLTQRPADVLQNEAGRTILEQSATVLLLRLNEASLEAIRDVYRLTDSEEQRLLEARPGEGVLRAGSWRLSIYVQPSRTELRLFSTKPQV